MSTCPNCGARVGERAAVCDSCGVSLGQQGGGQANQAGPGQNQGRPDEGQSRQDPPQGNPPQQGQPRQNHSQGNPSQQGQPRQGQPRQDPPQQNPSQQGQPRQGQPRQDPPQQNPSQQGHQQPGQPRGGQARGRDQGGVVAGLSRRQVLAVGGAGVLGVGGGAFFLLGGDDGGTRSPKETTREFITAMQSDDGETIRSLVHPDSPLDPDTLVGTDIQVTIQRLSVTGESEQQATVEATWTDNDGTSTFTLRKYDGEWLVYDIVE